MRVQYELRGHDAAGPILLAGVIDAPTLDAARESLEFYVKAELLNCVVVEGGYIPRDVLVRYRLAGATP